MLTNKPVRYNYNVPRYLVNDLKRVADARGMKPCWWIQKVLEKALKEELEKEFSSININQFESFRGQ